MPDNTPRTRARSLVLAASAGLLAALAAPSFGSSAQAAQQSPIVRSAGGRVTERGDAVTRDRSEFVESETTTTERLRSPGKGDSRTAELLLEEAWIYDATVEIFDDYDGDGYFTFLRVRFDADSIYAEHWVYARLFLTLDGEFWEEYHITGDFLVEGTTPYDEFEVETELVSGFAPGLYDVLIELYDADYGHFLGDFGPVQSSAFSLVPLEDIDNDYVPPPPVVVTAEHGGGGAAGIPSLAGLALLSGLSAMARRRRRSAARQSPNTDSAVD